MRETVVKEPFDLRAILATMKSAQEKDGLMNIWPRDIAAVEDAIETIGRLRSRPLPSEAEINAAIASHIKARYVQTGDTFGYEISGFEEAARAVLALLQGGDKRCAECDCENGGKDCNWIRQPSTPVSRGGGWQPIETAPKDGCFLIANAKGQVCPCQARDGSRLVCNMPGFHDWDWPEEATHWMPLPAPPSTPVSGGE